MNESPQPSPDVLTGSLTGHSCVIDLSYALSDALPPWPGDARSFEARAESSIASDGYFTRSFWMLEHYGTHLDAPAHFDPSGATVDRISPGRLFGPAVVLDVRDLSVGDPDCELAANRILRWEGTYGRIPPGAIVLLRTGWPARWPDRVRYANADADGVMHFPGFGVEAVRLCIERGVSGIGSDTMSVDSGRSVDFPVHRLALGAGLYHLENLADLTALPESGATLVVAPIKLLGGSGGPCRVFAFLPH